MTKTQVASHLKEHDAQKEEAAHETEAHDENECLVAGSAVKRVKPASVGGATAAAAGTYYGGTDEQKLKLLLLPS